MAFQLKSFAFAFKEKLCIRLVSESEERAVSSFINKDEIWMESAEVECGSQLVINFKVAFVLLDVLFTWENLHQSL